VGRIEKMCRSITEQLLKDVSNCVAFSLRLDESSDIRETAQLLVFIQMVFEDYSVKEVLLGMIYLTTGREIFNSLYSFVTKSDVPLHKLVSINTDGAKSMIG
jgi:hypothetical protein